MFWEVEVGVAHLACFGSCFFVAHDTCIQHQKSHSALDQGICITVCGPSPWQGSGGGAGGAQFHLLAAEVALAAECSREFDQRCRHLFLLLLLFLLCCRHLFLKWLRLRC